MSQKRKTIPYFTRSLLIQASRLGLEWDYNRQLSERIAEVPDRRYPVEFHFVHTHRHGKACEPHMRCVITLEAIRDSVVIVDVPFEFFDKLPRKRP